MAELLWGAARIRSVRQELCQLRRLPGAHEWLPDPDPLRLPATSDLQQFAAAVEERRYADALRLGQAPLLMGFDVPSAPASSDWLQVSRRQYEGLLLRALRGRLGVLERQAALSEGLDVADRILKLDPLDEAAYRSAMRLSYQGPPRGDAVERVVQSSSRGRRAAVEFVLDGVAAAVRCGLRDRRHEVREDVEDATPRPHVGGSRR